MNGKRAKMIRRLAIDNTPGDAPDRDIVLKNKSAIYSSDMSQGTGMNSPNSLRGVERAIKKAWKSRNQSA